MDITTVEKAEKQEKMNRAKIDDFVEESGFFRSAITTDELEAAGFKLVYEHEGESPDDYLYIYEDADGVKIGINSGDTLDNDECLECIG